MRQRVLAAVSGFCVLACAVAALLVVHSEFGLVWWAANVVVWVAVISGFLLFVNLQRRRYSARYGPPELGPPTFASPWPLALTSVSLVLVVFSWFLDGDERLLASLITSALIWCAALAQWRARKAAAGPSEQA